MVVPNQESARSGIVKIGLNEIALIFLIIVPFVYLMTKRMLDVEDRLTEKKEEEK